MSWLQAAYFSPLLGRRWCLGNQQLQHHLFQVWLLNVFKGEIQQRRGVHQHQQLQHPPPVQHRSKKKVQHLDLAVWKNTVKAGRSGWYHVSVPAARARIKVSFIQLHIQSWKKE
ncbi:hypothetical protein VIGAN_05194300 [Vigna angularis var. angularis]|uniref:Uncharacterized protein n=1 Tax=Vigna angularis var. angularis TaxID=157739 RepID=A0A0S3S6K7_PHAAN|nr:hypothetical protein VIGAN_05194300 [Vigna angularis var. angularis]